MKIRSRPLCIVTYLLHWSMANEYVLVNSVNTPMVLHILIRDRPNLFQTNTYNNGTIFFMIENCKRSNNSMVWGSKPKHLMVDGGVNI